jgi:DNA ligase-1
MKRFAALYDALDRTTSTNAKVAALESYFRSAPHGDAAWALSFLVGRRLKRLIPSRVLWELTRDTAGLPEWLLEHCYAAVGDFAEAMALLIAPEPGAGASVELGLEDWIRERVLPLRQMTPEAQAASVRRAWSALGRGERLVFNKIVTGEFRVGVAATLVMRALARVAGVAPETMAHRVMGDWEPSAAFFASLLSGEAESTTSARPYPFCLASPLEDPVESLGEPGEWLVEWKWDGIRAQAIRRGGATHLWSRGEELVTPRFPELTQALSALPDGTVLDGEILAWRDGGALSFAVLQRRIGRLALTPRVLAEAPVVFMAYDLLEDGGRDVRERPLDERRQRLEALLAGAPTVLHVSPRLGAGSWEELARAREESRARNVEGLMLKRLSSAYVAGRRRGDWWKWKIAPHTVDAVLTHAHPGHGRRASLFTDYTFAVWDGDALVPVAKAYSGLSDAEIRELDAWVRRHTRERFGPTRAVDPVRVFELAFEAAAPSTRHRSGIALRFPRILRWRKDKAAAQADTLASLRALLRLPEPEQQPPPAQGRLPFGE